MGMAIRQPGHSFVVGAAGAGAGCSRFILFSDLIFMKIANTAVMNLTRKVIALN
jgi:hypothetical protein